MVDYPKEILIKSEQIKRDYVMGKMDLYEKFFEMKANNKLNLALRIGPNVASIILDEFMEDLEKKNIKCKCSYVYGLQKLELCFENNLNIKEISEPDFPFYENLRKK